MGRTAPGSYDAQSWTPPSYTVAHGKVVGGYHPTGPHNWGRWGERDVRGTLNLITPADVAAAASLVTRGVVFSLALPIDDRAPRWSQRAAAVHYFTMTGSDAISGLPYSALEPGVTLADDYIHMPLQGSTQWDGFAHWSYRDCLYNGFWAGGVTAAGSQDVDISRLKDRFVGRGVLLDVARHRGTGALPPGTAIGPDLLEEVAGAQGVRLRAGDILLVRTGHLAAWYAAADGDPMRQTWGSHAPGISRTAIAWLHRLDIAALATDTQGVEVAPNELPIERPQPLHHAALVDLGLPLGELWWMEALADDCAADGRYEFMLTAPPLNIPGAVGSVLNPLAMK